MSRAGSFFSSISTPRIYTERSARRAKRSRSQELVTVALFSCIGLLISFVAMIFGVQGAWF
jgi:hypothetical protein